MNKVELICKIDGESYFHGKNFVTKNNGLMSYNLLFRDIESLDKSRVILNKPVVGWVFSCGDIMKNPSKVKTFLKYLEDFGITCGIKDYDKMVRCEYKRDNYLEIFNNGTGLGIRFVQHASRLGLLADFVLLEVLHRIHTTLNPKIEKTVNPNLELNVEEKVCKAFYGATGKNLTANDLELLEVLKKYFKEN